MSGRYLLDTNIVIALFANEKIVVDQIRKSKEVFISTVVLGELYYGGFNSSKQKLNLGRLDDLSEKILVLDCTRETSRIYGETKYELKKKGKPIPENDIWIASIAKQHSLTLVTRDKHFDNIENLPIENW